MENRRKFYSGGSWSRNDIKKRFENICWVLDAYNKKKIDDLELKFIIKNGFVSKVYVSEKVFSRYKDTDFGAQANVYNNILNGKHDVLGTNTFDICKAVENRSKSYNTKGIKIEHVIPYNDNNFLTDVKNIKTFNDFKTIFDVVCICLVTEDEDERLRNSGLRQKMPYGVNYKVTPFARYDKAGVYIHGWKIVNGNLIKNP